MRWWGDAKRAHDIATDHAKSRQALGKALIEHEGAGFLLADNEIDLHLSRLAIWHTACVLDQGGPAGRSSSLTKVVCSETLNRVADRSQKILGGLGVSHDTVVAQIAAGFARVQDL